MRAGCVFCGIVSGTAPATVLRGNAETVVFEPLDPVCAGHVLVVPRVHVSDAVERPWVSAVVMFDAAEWAARYESSNILTSVGAAASQSVFHLHVHVVPRVSGDLLMLPWGTTGNPHDPHRCSGMEILETELRVLRGEL